MKTNSCKSLTRLIFNGALFLFLFACKKDAATPEEIRNATESASTASSRSLATAPVLLVIDEESIDNGNPPNNFSNVDVNDQLARIGLRQTLRYFQNNVGRTIELFTGEVGDEGWHAIKTIPNSWISTGPTPKGFRNYLLAGPGLGSGEGPEVLLDKIPNVTPLRARGLKMLTGKTVLAVVYDGDVSINYSPLQGSLKGSNLGVVAFEVLQVRKRTDGSSGSLPRVTIRIVKVENLNTVSVKLFSNAPVPRSSSEPFDITPPSNVPPISLVDAR